MNSSLLDERPPIRAFSPREAQWAYAFVMLATEDSGGGGASQDSPLSSPKSVWIIITIVFAVSVLCVILMVPLWFCLSRHYVRNALRNFFLRHSRSLPTDLHGSFSAAERGGAAPPRSSFSRRCLLLCCCVESDSEMEQMGQLPSHGDGGRSECTTDGVMGLEVKNRYLGGGVEMGDAGGGGAEGVMVVASSESPVSKEFSLPLTDGSAHTPRTVMDLLDQIANVEKYLEEILPYYVQAESVSGQRSHPNSEHAVPGYFTPSPPLRKSANRHRSSMSGAGSTSGVGPRRAGVGGAAGGGGVGWHVEDPAEEEGLRGRQTPSPVFDQEWGEWLVPFSSRRVAEEGGGGGWAMASSNATPPEGRSGRSPSPYWNGFADGQRSPSPFAHMHEVPLVRPLPVHPSPSAPLLRLSPTPLPHSTTPLLPHRGRSGSLSTPIRSAFESSMGTESSFHHSFRTPPTSRRRYHAQTPLQDRSTRHRSRGSGRRGGGGGGGGEDTEEKTSRLSVLNPLASAVPPATASHPTNASLVTTPLSGRNSVTSSRLPFASLVSATSHPFSTKGLPTQRNGSVRAPPSARGSSGVAIIEGSSVASEPGCSQVLISPSGPTVLPFPSVSGAEGGNGRGSPAPSVGSRSTTTNPMGEAAAATALMYLNWRAQCETMPRLPEKNAHDAEGKGEVEEVEPGEK